VDVSERLIEASKPHRMRQRGQWAAALLAALMTTGAAGAARADDKPTLSGSWTASPLSESWSVSSWGDDCGSKPTPKGAGGGAVQIREQGGELSIVGAGRAFSTAECWEQMPGLARTSHSQSGGGRFWRTRCSTPANHSLQAIVVTTISATDNAISLNETGQYQVVVKDSVCKTSVTRSRSFSLVRRDGETPPAASASASASASAVASAPPAPPKPEPKPAARCAQNPGEPARLEVHPSRKLLRAGERFSFRGLVLDAEGCPTGARPTWSVAPGPLADKVALDPSGGVTVADDAPEGSVELVAAALGKSVRVTLEVAKPANYDALLAARGLDAAGEQDEGAFAVIATGTVGGRMVAAEDAARERKTTFVAIVAGVAALLGFAGLVLVRRGTRKDAPAESAESAEDAPPSGMTAPAAVATAAVATAAPERAGAPHDGEKKAERRARDRGKICPTCGERYDGEAKYCGKDATELVLLN